jgi:hypothetical protein
VTRAPQLPSAPDEPARLDELMLAMDVVDTLRHEQQLVERELAGEARADALVARLGEIYAGQGIAVPEHVLREGVSALEQDRFAYTPPPRTFAVALAHLYVTRMKWAPIAVLLALFAGGATFAVGYALDATTEQRVMDVARAFERADDVVDEAQRELAELERDAQLRRAELSAAAAVAAAPHWQVFESARSAAAGAIEEARTSLIARQERPTDARSASFLSRSATQFGEDARAAVANVRAAFAPIETLWKSDREAQSLLVAIEALPLDGAARERFASVRGEFEAAQRRGDAREVANALAGLETLRTNLERSYELVIVSRPGAESGFWREDVIGGGRNYYVVVEPRSANGREIDLAILDEEEQRTRTVSRFAQRVPESFFEEVRADKLDNGIVDRGPIAVKRRGELEERLSITVAGGRITRW